MKKLSSKQMKEITGGAPPLCLYICNAEYRYCLSHGGTEADCTTARTACWSCECDNIC